MAEEFHKFCELNGIRYIQVAPHWSSNGLAERGVQVYKQGFWKIKIGTVHDRFAQFQFQYRLTPHSTTGVSPAELLLGCPQLDLLQPSNQQQVLQEQLKQKQDHDQHYRTRSFAKAEEVFLQNIGLENRWHIRAQTDPVPFEIQLQDGRTCH